MKRDIQRIMLATAKSLFPIFILICLGKLRVTTETVRRSNAMFY